MPKSILYFGAGLFGEGGDVPNIGARVYNSANISLTHDTTTDLTFNSERWDTSGIHSTSSNTERLTCQTAGLYIIVGNVLWEGNATGKRRVLIELNDTTLIGTSEVSTVAATGERQQCVTIYELAVGDYVKLIAYQNSTVSLDVQAVGNESPEFMMQLIAES